MGHEESGISADDGAANLGASGLGEVCKDGFVRTGGALFWVSGYRGGVNHFISFSKLMCWDTITVRL